MGSGKGRIASALCNGGDAHHRALRGTSEIHPSDMSNVKRMLRQN